MYCAACGNEINDKLNYCKNCGAKIVKDEEETPGSVLNQLLVTLTWVALGGFGILVGLIAVLLKKDFAPPGIAIIASIYLAALFGICFMILKQLPKLIDAKLAPKQQAPQSYEAPQLFAKTTAQLGERREPASVTEQTTRNFEKIPLK